MQEEAVKNLFLIMGEREKPYASAAIKCSLKDSDLGRLVSF